MNAWIFLGFAIVMEVMGTSCMKLSEGLTRLWPTVLMFVFYGFAFAGLSLALKTLEMSVAYAIWAGVGIVLITLIDLFVFRSALSLLKLFSIALIVLGTVLLKYFSVE